MSLNPKKVFISYSHQEAPHRHTLEQALRSRNHETRCDVGQEHVTPDLHREISANINWADVIVPIVTEQWLHSHECRDEIVRANERRKRIVPFRKQGLTDDGPPRVPFFLRDTAIFIPWTDRTIAKDAETLADELLALDIPKWQADSFTEVRQLGDVVQNSAKAPPWQASLAKKVTRQCVRRVKDVLTSNECSFDVSHETSYLSYADPIFANATQVIAICIAKISTFWTERAFRPASVQYLRGQANSADSIVRLFVFEDPAEALGFRNILSTHHRQYGRKPGNGVFLCSTEAYRDLLETWGFDSGAERLQEDFGVLTFDNSEQAMHAVLNRHKFAYSLFDDDDSAISLRARVVREVMRGLLQLGEGEIDGELRVARWHGRWSRDQEELAEGLQKLFPLRAGRVRHYVVLRPEQRSKALEELVYGLAARFESRREALHILDVNVDRRCESVAVDGRYREGLGVDDAFQFILRLDFANVDALNFYYSHHIHSAERETLYRALEPSTGVLFDEANDLIASEPAKARDKFRAIERKMIKLGRLVRFDVSDEVPVGELVKRQA